MDHLDKIALALWEWQLVVTLSWLALLLGSLLLQTDPGRFFSFESRLSISTGANLLRWLRQALSITLWCKFSSWVTWAQENSGVKNGKELKKKSLQKMNISCIISQPRLKKTLNMVMFWKRPCHRVCVWHCVSGIRAWENRTTGFEELRVVVWFLLGWIFLWGNPDLRGKASLLGIFTG